MLFFVMVITGILMIPAALHADTPQPFSSLKKKLIADGFDSKSVESIYANPKVKEDMEMVRLFF